MALIERFTPKKLEEITIPLRRNSAALFFDIATQAFGGFGSENDSFLGHEKESGGTLKAGEKTVAIHQLQRYNTPNLNMKKSPSGQAAAADAAPGQEGLFDHMFDHRQLRNTRKQWS